MVEIALGESGEAVEAGQAGEARKISEAGCEGGGNGPYQRGRSRWRAGTESG